MKTSTKIWLCIAGLLLIILGVICIAKPDITLVSAAWMLGCFTLIAGISKLVFTFKTQAFLPNSGTRTLSALLDIFFGCFFLFNNLGTAVSLPVVFAIWVMIEGVVIAVQSFDYKRVGFPMWWVLLLLSAGAAVLGWLGLRNLDVTAEVLSALIGIAIIANGLAYILAVVGVSRFEKRVDRLGRIIDIDEQ
ncbi:MAG: DUF308 domain-containing protein [Bacteroidales bacterium]|nr:DUF308 domain-containing protein [Bacteroidales bacterium]MBR0292330.1 DUF308 domain-containing protein [Bacteroidales bacterium]